MTSAGCRGQAQAARARRKYPALASKRSSSPLLMTLKVEDFQVKRWDPARGAQVAADVGPETAEEVLAELNNVRCAVPPDLPLRTPCEPRPHTSTTRGVQRR